MAGMRPAVIREVQIVDFVKYVVTVDYPYPGDGSFNSEAEAQNCKVYLTLRGGNLFGDV